MGKSIAIQCRGPNCIANLASTAFTTHYYLQVHNINTFLDERTLFTLLTRLDLKGETACRATFI